MKQCPVCKTTYPDESLKFCLADGTNLISLSEPAETVQMSFDKNPMRINVPPDSAPTIFTPPISNPPVKKGVSPIIVGILAGLLLLVVVGFASFAAYIALKPTDKTDAVVTVSPTPKISPTTTPDDKTAELKEKLAEIFYRIEFEEKD